MFVFRHWSTFVGKVLHENAGQPPKSGFESFGANSNFVRKTRIFRTFHRQMLRPAKNEGCKMFVSTRWTIYFLEVLSKNAGQPPKSGFESTSVHVIVKIPHFSRTLRFFLAEWLRRLTFKGVDGGSNPVLISFCQSILQWNATSLRVQGAVDGRGWVEYFLQFMSKIFQ